MDGCFLVCLVLYIMLTVGRKVDGLTRGRDALVGEFPFIVRILVSEKVSAIATFPTVSPPTGTPPTEVPSTVTSPEKPSVRAAETSSIGALNLPDGEERAYSGAQGPTESSERGGGISTDEDPDPTNLGEIWLFLMHEFSSNNATKIAAGVLITTTRVLTNCETVASFTGSSQEYIKWWAIVIMAGSINHTGYNGEFQFPKKNTMVKHPYCHFFISSKTVLFNAGILEVAKPFGFKVEPGMVAPISRSFLSGDRMGDALVSMIGDSDIQCHTIGWGNDNKRYEGQGMPDAFLRFSKVLQTTTMEIVDYSECHKEICKHFQQCLLPLLEYGLVCARAKEGGPCTEDWSSPLLCGGMVFGLHVEPQRCKDVAVPRLFSRIDLMFQFVFDVTNRSHTNAGGVLGIYVTLLAFYWQQYD